MPHVDEGILHAYIDGALDALGDAGELPEGMTARDVVDHLASCADCRARLDAEREVRERAGLVLRDAAPPHVEPLPFAALEQAQRARRRTTLPLAWAASLLVAAGAGWWGSALWRGEPAPVRTSAAEAEAGAVSGAQQESIAQIPPPPVVPTDMSAGAEAQRAAAQEDVPAVARDADASTRSAERAERVADPGAAVSPDPAARGMAAADVSRAAAPETGAANVTSAPPAPLLRQTPAPGRRVAPATVPPAAQSFVESVAADVFTTVITPSPELLTFENLLTREQAGGLLFHLPTSGDSVAIADQLFVLDGSSEADLEVAPEIAQVTVRIRQTLETGEPVEVITWRRQQVALESAAVTGAMRPQEPAAGAAAKARTDERRDMARAPQSRLLRDGRRQLVLHDAQSDTWIAIRADGTEAKLRALADRLTRTATARH